jgi:hypothetical protein
MAISKDYWKFVPCLYLKLNHKLTLQSVRAKLVLSGEGGGSRAISTGTGNRESDNLPKFQFVRSDTMYAATVQRTTFIKRLLAGDARMFQFW